MSWPKPEARQLLDSRLGCGRVAAEPAAAMELTALCARLPLALSIAAARAAARPALPLAALAAELRDARTRLDALGTGDAATDMRTVFSWSCQQLTEPAARMFRLLGVHPGPDITARAAASLAGVPPSHAGQALAELARALLTTEHPPGRFACHDLLRAYAAEQAASHDSDADRRAALHRVLDHYLHTACAASLLLHSHRDPITLEPPQPQARPEQLAGPQQALDWFRAERQVLLAAVSQAAGGGFSAHAWQLPWALAGFLHWYGYWPDLAATQQTALAAQGPDGEQALQVEGRRLLALASLRLGDYDEASTHLARALQLVRHAGGNIAWAQVCTDLAAVAQLHGDGVAALGHAQQALLLYLAAGQRRGEANALNNLGWHHAHLGGYQAALDYCGQALALHRELVDRPGEAATLDTLGYAHHHLGHQEDAIACCQQALETSGEACDPHIRAQILTHLGDAHHAAGHPDAASRAWQQALDILDAFHDPAAAQLRSRLASSSSSGWCTATGRHGALTLAWTARMAFFDG